MVAMLPTAVNALPRPHALLFSFLALLLLPLTVAADAVPVAGVGRARSSKLHDAAVLTMDDIDAHRISARDVAGGQNYFTNPPIWYQSYDYQDDPMYHVGDTLNITWETSWGTVDVILCQPALDKTYGQATISANTTQLWHSWTVTTADVVVPSGPVGNVFFLLIHPSGSPIPLVQSHYFNVSQPAPGEQPVIINAPGFTTPVLSSHNTSSVPSAANSSVPTSTPTAANGPPPGALSVGAIIATSVVAGFAASVIVAALVWFFCVVKKRRRMMRDRERDLATTKRVDSAHSSVQLEAQGWVLAEAPADDQPREIGSAPLPHEVEAREAPVELPGWDIAEMREMEEKEAEKEEAEKKEEEEMKGEEMKEEEAGEKRYN